MPETSSNDSGLKTTILFAAVLISAALTYGGYQYSQSGGSAISDEMLDAAVERFNQQQAAEYQAAQVEANKLRQVVSDEAELKALEDDDAVLGDPNAPVTIVEFSDYECPFCKRHATQVLPLLKEQYIDTGKVKLVFRDLPLDFHDPLATQEAIAAECAREQGGDATYYEYHDLIFETTNSNGQGLEKSQLYDLAGQVGVDKSKFTECLDSEKYEDEVQKDMAAAQKYGISGTPGFLVNGWFINGAQPFSVFEEIIEQELAQQ